MSGRHPCACRRCTCPNTAYRAGDPCPSCSVGAHRPAQAVQDHLARGLEEWIRLMPSTLGSSGLTDRQLELTAQAWQAWHDERPCPVAR